MRSFFFLVVFSVMMALGVVGCSSDSTGGGTSGGTSGSTSGGTQYRGTFSGKGEGGSIDVTVAAASSGGIQDKAVHILATLQVTGTLKITGGATSTITGTYDDVTKTLTITGGGYSFTGTLGANGISGTYSGPNGSGSFNVLQGDGSKAYCGTYTTPQGGGVWNFTVSGSTLVGNYADANGGGTLTGTVDASGNVTVTPSGGAGSATGKITGDTASGTHTNGTWTGKICGT